MMIRRSFPVLFILLTLSFVTYSAIFAAESPTCDEGDIKNVSLRIKGEWYLRPDARIDGEPQSKFHGPFFIKANLEPESTIEKVSLFYSIDGTNFDTQPMRIRNNNIITGKIPRVKIPRTESTSIHFYLQGFNADGDSVWLDEIPYTCPPDEYTQGDSYNFFISSWRK